ncbi:hypothetical protein PP182_08850 [Maribacter sp. PR1]|uniref:SMODS and SLOG-associating 2TM effector domain-containing protein n=1 Tax=Maribacter cobaltidurans TaxID=1178778 RepID=A0ABU7IT72_9FLAO|nr:MULTISPECIES: hypothetical protein [Maribacter]MDC6388788.1 hypothetical protein [Maribacter sp. PR1]MEE1976177.1 hypothetical protein [Maribacter cobaltidurans]
MRFIETFLSNIFSEVKILREKEDDSTFEVDYSAKSLITDNLDDFDNSSNFSINNDTFNCTVTIGNSEPITLNSQDFNIANFLEELNEEFIHQEDEKINIKILIQKQLVNSTRNIYDFKLFTKTINALNASQFFSVFTRAFSNGSVLTFNTIGLEKPINTTSIFFVPINNTEFNEPTLSRKSVISKLNTVCHYDNVDSHFLSPADFSFEDKISVDNVLLEIFDFYSNVLSIIYLFDITSLNGDILDYKINGYKSFKGSIDLSNIKLSYIQQYFPIFKWVYDSGNLNDKIGLSRNIITLHLNKSEEFKLDKNVYQSIQSSYKVYEKDNIKQYVEVRNKISDQLLDFNNKATKIVESFASGFQKSSLALISFYISTIVIRVLSKGDFINVFTLDAIILSTAFIIGSVIYYFVSRWEIKVQRARFVKSYENLKDRYLDLLDQNDINRILNNDSDYIDNLSFIDKKKRIYSILWFSILTLLFCASMILYLLYNVSDITDTELYKKISEWINN